jgi:hypothetical protein
MKWIAIITIVALLTEVFAYEKTTTINLKPRWYCMIQLKDINKISIQAYDRNNNLVTVYLNRGLVDYFDPRNSLIACNDVSTCNVDGMGLVSGAYTLFVFNDYYLFEQSVSLTVLAYTAGENMLFYSIVAIVTGVFLGFGLFVACTIKKYRNIQSNQPQIETAI